jgi:hypothetical protein
MDKSTGTGLEQIKTGWIFTANLLKTGSEMTIGLQGGFPQIFYNYAQVATDLLNKHS